MYLSSLVSERNVQLARQQIQQFNTALSSDYLQTILQNFDVLYSRVIRNINQLSNLLTEPVKVNQVDDVSLYRWWQHDIHHYLIGIERSDWSDTLYVTFLQSQDCFNVVIAQKNTRQGFDVNSLTFDLHGVLCGVHYYRIANDASVTDFIYEGRYLFNLTEDSVQCWSSKYNDFINQYPLTHAELKFSQPK